MKKIVFLPGDGIGKDVADEAVKVLKAVGRKYSREFDISEELIGGASIDVHGTPMTEEVVEKCKSADAVFLGAIGGPKWDHVPFEQKAERALIRIRKELGVFANLRPVKAIDVLNEASPLKSELVKGIDLMILRELTGGLYYGTPKERKMTEKGEYAVDAMVYYKSEIERITHQGFQIAMQRRKKLTSVDKENVLVVSGLWRDTVNEIAKEYPEVEVNHLLVDNAAMQLILNPAQFDVLLTENTFGDILSDEASVLTGSLGMLPSASLGEFGALYEPCHGSAPDITGMNKANPIGAIKSVAMMLKYSFDMGDIADSIDNAVEKTLSDGFMTADVATPTATVLGTSEIADKIIENM